MPGPDDPPFDVTQLDDADMDRMDRNANLAAYFLTSCRKAGLPDELAYRMVGDWHSDLLSLEEA